MSSRERDGALPARAQPQVIKEFADKNAKGQFVFKGAVPAIAGQTPA